MSAAASPLDVMCELALAEDLATRFRIYIANDDVDGVSDLLTHEHVALGLSDAGAHVGQLCDAPLPTDLLGNWVRERGVMPLERAVRKLTGEPADMFGFVRRGYLREGDWADVCVFDPQTVGPGPVRRVRDFPANGERLTAEEPTGVRHVLVNGTPIRRDGVAARLGRAASRHATGDRLTRLHAHALQRTVRKNVPEVVDEQLGLLHGREVPAARHVDPVGHVVTLLHPRSGEAQDLFLRIARDAGGNSDVLRRLLQHAAVHGLPVQARRRRDGLRDPVEHHVGDQLIAGEDGLRIAVAVTPRAELLHDPREQPGGRVVERDAQRLRLGPLHLRVAGLVALEARHRGEVGLLLVGERARVLGRRRRSAC